MIYVWYINEKRPFFNALSQYSNTYIEKIDFFLNLFTLTCKSTFKRESSKKVSNQALDLKSLYSNSKKIIRASVFLY